jgi:colanic acid/amylovoran biosynthesis protein
VRQTADPAFLLAPIAKEQAHAMLNFYGVDPTQPAVALSISQGISRFASVDKAAHFRAWQQVVKDLLADGIEQIVLVPHVQSTSANNDDRIVATELIKQFDYDPRLHLAGGNHSAAEFKGMISACDMVIAERMHAAIAGLSTATCTVVVGYSVKADGIMKDMLSPELPHNEFLIPIQNFVKTEETTKVIRSAWQRRDHVVERLQQVLPGVKEKSRQNFELVGDLFDKPNRIGEPALAMS